MNPSKKQRREEKKRGKQERLEGLRKRSAGKQLAEIVSRFPKFDAIKVLSIGEGRTAGFACELARSYLARGVSGKVVAVDPEPADYTLPENMSHVKGDAISFLKSLPAASVGRVHDHFAADQVALNLRHLAAIEAVNSMQVAAETGGRFAQASLKRKMKQWEGRAREYFSEVKRVLRGGGSSCSWTTTALREISSLT